MTALVALTSLAPFLLVGLLGYWIGKGHARRASFCAKCGREFGRG
jgi:hypothetical protein